MNPQNSVIPKVVGSFIGFILFGIIGRFAWNGLNENDIRLTKQGGKKE